MTTYAPDEEDLVRRAVGRDREAFGILYEIHSNDIYRRAIRKVGQIMLKMLKT